MKKNWRALRIVHGAYGAQPGDTPAVREQRMRARLAELKEKGYGGIVTNVRFDGNYLKDPAEWQLLKQTVQACRELGLRLWLYDENGYPSGTACTQTLAADPDYEARALVMVQKILAPGESGAIPLPRGHEKLIAAAYCPMRGAHVTDEELLALRPCAGEEADFKNDTAAPQLCLAFFEKHMYEGAHCEHNVCSSRRYIDVSNPDAVAEFIRNTYSRYTDAVGESYARYPGDPRPGAVVEAFFTDEPSYMGVYLNAGLYPPHVDHPFDDTLPLYPVVNWGRDAASRFAAVYGYRLEEHLAALFMGEDEAFCRVRHDFYQLMSDLYEQAFFAQLGDYCGRHGVSFSGHILLEDELPLHVQFEGNYFSLLRHMQIPGIDMLQSTPQTVWDFAFTPRLVRSIAELYGRPHVMDEVSAFAQGGTVSARERYVALMLQFAFGADTFTSYYSDDDPDGSFRRTLDALAFAGERMDAPRLSDTLLFYPIETMMRRRRPPQPDCPQAGDPDAAVQACWHAVQRAMYACLDGQKSFTFADCTAAQRQAPGRWRAFVIPACDVVPQLVSAASALAAGGCRIVWYAPEGSEFFAAQCEKLPAGTQCARTPAELLALLRPEGPVFTGDTAGVACAETGRYCLLVNRDDRPRELACRAPVAAAWDPDGARPVPLAAGPDGVRFTLGPSAALLLQKG